MVTSEGLDRNVQKYSAGIRLILFGKDFVKWLSKQEEENFPPKNLNLYVLSRVCTVFVLE